jgi:hypothetical protein
VVRSVVAASVGVAKLAVEPVKQLELPIWEELDMLIQLFRRFMRLVRLLGGPALAPLVRANKTTLDIKVTEKTLDIFRSAKN